MAEDRQQLLQEAYDRGILPPDMKAAFEEAKKRGIVSGAPAQPQSSGIGDFVKSIPTGIVGTAASFARGEQIESEQRAMAFTDKPNAGPEVPTGDKATEAFGLHKPEGFMGRVGEGVGGALTNPATYVGPGGLAVKVGGAIASAFGSEAAGELTKGTKYEPLARIGGGIITGGAAGVTAAEIQAARFSRGLPSADAIKQSAQSAYDQIANARLQATQQSVDTLTSDITTALDADLIVPTSAPRTFRALEQLQTGGGDVAQMMAVRQKLGKIGPQEGTDYAAASHVREAIDEFIEKLDAKDVVAGDPKFTAAMLGHARQSWKSYKQLETLERVGEEAEHRAASTGTGANAINTIRQNVRKILDSDKKSRGFSREAKEQMEKIVMGTWATNRARWASKFAPSGVVSTGFGVLAGEATSPGVGAVVMTGGLIGRYLGEYLTKRQLRELENIIRLESPIGKATKVPARATSGGIPAAAARGGAVGLDNFLDSQP